MVFKLYRITFEGSVDFVVPKDCITALFHCKKGKERVVIIYALVSVVGNAYAGY